MGMWVAIGTAIGIGSVRPYLDPECVLHSCQCPLRPAKRTDQGAVDGLLGGTKLPMSNILRNH